MNCKRAQAQIALAVGGDLDDAAERELHEHLGGCVDCHRHWKQMSDTWALLLDREDELPDPHDSVWPDLRVKLPNRRELMSRARFNGWHYYEVLQSVLEKQGLKPMSALAN